MSAKVKLENFLRTGTAGQFFRRDPSTPTGGAWVNNAFPGEAAGSQTATFTTPANATTISIVDTGINDTSVVTLSIGVPASRAQDELELEPMLVQRGAMTVNGGFDVIVSCANDSQKAEGAYVVHWSRK